MNRQPTPSDKVKKDPFLYKIVRHCFRVPVEDSENVWVKIEGNQYPIRDICLDGVGVTLDDPAGFSVSQVIMNCELTVFGQSIQGLNGRVIHFSLNSGKDWQCGIQWINITDDAGEQIARIVANLKDEFLKDEDQTD